MGRRGFLRAMRATVMEAVGINALTARISLHICVAKTETMCYTFLFAGLTPRRPGGVALGVSRKDEIDLIARRGE